MKTMIVGMNKSKFDHQKSETKEKFNLSIIIQWNFYFSFEF